MSKLTMLKFVTGMAAGIILSATFSGCGTTGNRAVPSSKITGNLANGSFELTLPKDGGADSIIIDRLGTNSVKVDIRGLKVQNNPEVVAASYAGQVQLLTIQMQTLQEMVRQLTLQINQAAASYAGRYQPLPTTTHTNTP